MSSSLIHRFAQTPCSEATTIVIQRPPPMAKTPARMLPRYLHDASIQPHKSQPRSAATYAQTPFPCQSTRSSTPLATRPRPTLLLLPLHLPAFLLQAHNKRLDALERKHSRHRSWDRSYHVRAHPVVESAPSLFLEYNPASADDACVPRLVVHPIAGSDLSGGRG